MNCKTRQQCSLRPLNPLVWSNCWRVLQFLLGSIGFSTDRFPDGNPAVLAAIVKMRKEMEGDNQILRNKTSTDTLICMRFIPDGVS